MYSPDFPTGGIIMVARGSSTPITLAWRDQTPREDTLQEDDRGGSKIIVTELYQVNKAKLLEDRSARARETR